MSDRISINIGLYNENMDNLSNEISSVEGTVKTSETFDKTNITPFTNDLEHTIRAIELLDKYKELLVEDIAVFKKTGEKIREQDEALSQVHHHDPRDGHQPMPM